MDDEHALIAGVLQAPLDRFTSERADVVRRLRKEGRRELADRMAALRKPPLALWAVNQSAGVAAADLDAVRQAGGRLRSAQEDVLRGDRDAAGEMQAALAAQRQAVDTLTRRLGMVLSASGHAAGDATMRRIGETLRAASIADAETWTALREGRLTAEPDATGFPTVDVPVEDVASRKRALDEETNTKRVRQATDELKRAEDLQKAAREQMKAAQLRLQQATRAVDAARELLEALRREQRDQ
jgi:hypothetical protein